MQFSTGSSGDVLCFQRRPSFGTDVNALISTIARSWSAACEDHQRREREFYRRFGSRSRVLVISVVSSTVVMLYMLAGPLNFNAKKPYEFGGGGGQISGSVQIILHTNTLVMKTMVCTYTFLLLSED